MSIRSYIKCKISLLSISFRYLNMIVEKTKGETLNKNYNCLQKTINFKVNEKCFKL